ncbi:MAG: holo-ACP synthase [Candidatus Dasytiphilus stammeri]
MGIIGVGTDLVEIKRIAEIVSKYGEKFSHRILSDYEMMEFNKNCYPVNFLAKRFAVKEAAAKAFGLRSGKIFQQFEIFHDYYGQPHLKCWQTVALIAEDIGVKCIHVTITDEREYALATVIIETNS